MPVLNRDDFFAKINEIVGDDTSETALSFIEDMTDTYSALEETGNDDRVKELEEELEATNAAWRKRYKERFFSGGRVNSFTDPEQLEDEQNALNEDITIEDLLEEATAPETTKTEPTE